MDILNWLYLAKNKFVRTTPSSDKDLMVFGAKVGFNKRGDLYQNYAMSIEDFAAALPAPAPAYKVYTALLTQSGIANPTAIVLENTIGNIVFTYVSNGVFEGTLSNAFPIGQTVINISQQFSFSGPNFQLSWINDTARTVNKFQIRVVQNGAPSDGLLLNTPIEIRVYN